MKLLFSLALLLIFSGCASAPKFAGLPQATNKKVHLIVVPSEYVIGTGSVGINTILEGKSFTSVGGGINPLQAAVSAVMNANAQAIAQSAASFNDFVKKQNFPISVDEIVTKQIAEGLKAAGYQVSTPSDIDAAKRLSVSGQGGGQITYAFQTTLKGAPLSDHSTIIVLHHGYGFQKTGIYSFKPGYVTYVDAFEGLTNAHLGQVSGHHFYIGFAKMSTLKSSNCSEGVSYGNLDYLTQNIGMAHASLVQCAKEVADQAVSNLIAKNG
jgi:hypothetical protein